MHAPKKKKKKDKTKKKQKDEIYEPKGAMTRKRQQSVANEPKKKRQRLNVCECVDCGFEAKSKTGLSVHQRIKKHGKYSCDPPKIALNDEDTGNKAVKCGHYRQ